MSLQAQSAFIGRWNVVSEIVIPAEGDYNYYYESVTDLSFNGSGIGHDVEIISLPSGYPTGQYRVYLTPSGSEPLHRILFNNDPSHQPSSFVELEQWGNAAWSSMAGMFWGCNNMVVTATDIPNTSNVTSMHSTFRGCTLFNHNVGIWDVSQVTDMSYMFAHTLFFNISVNDWDVSNVVNMEGLFNMTIYNQPLDNWDVSQVVNMSHMFENAYMFNQDISMWDVSNVTDMSYMFKSAGAFNQNINDWDVSNVTDMSYMFSWNNAFNQPLNNWDVSQVTTMAYMFNRAEVFNQPIHTWNVSQVTDMTSMFEGAYVFNQFLTGWDVSQVQSMARMFKTAFLFNSGISSWNVSNVVTMSEMFHSATSFNQNILGWDVSNVEDMSHMFSHCVQFNKAINLWDVSHVKNMEDMFNSAVAFNQDISAWDVSGVENMRQMFYNADAFNQPLNSWNVSQVKDMEAMFAAAEAFNQPLDAWDVSQVVNMQDMFNSAHSFNQNLGAWTLSSLSNAIMIFNASGMDCKNYSYTLIGWAENPATASSVNATEMYIGSYDVLAEDARASLISDKLWTINGDVLDIYCITPCIDMTISLIGTTTLMASEPESEDVSYQWVRCETPLHFISGATDRAYTPTVTGDYAVIIEKGSCRDTSDCIPVVISTSIESSNVDLIEKFYPNPSSDYLNIETSQIIESIFITNVLGQIIYTQPSVQKASIQINVQAWIPGWYNIHLVTKSGIKVSSTFMKL